jgi:hypothetical protein
VFSSVCHQNSVHVTTVLRRQTKRRPGFSRSTAANEIFGRWNACAASAFFVSRCVISRQAKLRAIDRSYLLLSISAPDRMGEDDNRTTREQPG